MDGRCASHERALIHGDENGQRIARQELGRMAEQADRYVEAQRAAFETPVEQNPDVFIDRWNMEDAQSECDWLNDEQARQVLTKYLDRDLSDDFQIIRTIAEEYVSGGKRGASCCKLRTD